MQHTTRSRLLHRLGRKRLVVLPNDPDDQDEGKYEKQRLQQQAKSPKLIAAIILVILGGLELAFLGETIHHEPTKLDEIAKTQMKINLNITFHRMLCEECRLHLMDLTGRQIFDTWDTVKKTPLDNQGKPLLQRNYTKMDDFVSPHNISRSQRLQRGEGCNLVGHLHTYRTVGNFHVVMGPGAAMSDGMHIHQMLPQDRPNFKVSHTIHTLRLDDEVSGALDGKRFHMDARNGTTALVQYHLKVVPTRKTKNKQDNSKALEPHETNRYDVNDTKIMPLYNERNFSPGMHHGNANNIIPGVFWILNMHHLTEVAHKEEFGWYNVIRPLFFTTWIVVLLLLVDEAFFGTRRRLLQQRPRARILEIV
mmetsp:Transcript_14066/g.20784  ORF Transcript_14066/g.20784 Transcript_14066/m.20784 type:complete len:364 (+) Transcript_14066:165-1256(+)|eukprot:CAMPEP_0194213530 /NCGR_PEP_ID=MMETSP0156-20130528/14199_1 /TAXON_ID=33649 /ORGANISM="Thalassionema nitzschioides, Strain L26-B" /LENGTH=363 /DNA_ID=CAMNT_0038941583 /DNA_START=106 /DNA_END=1197 /DNA_ORIENTATION=+